jgi:hypothetical protein
MGMITILSLLVSRLSFRVRSRAALRHQASCGGNALVSFGSSPPTGSSGCGFTEFGVPYFAERALKA